MRSRPLAFALAAVGAGLLLYRPDRVPELLPGARASSGTPPALAAAIAYPPAAALPEERPADDGPEERAEGPGGDEGAPDDLRDAPASAFDSAFASPSEGGAAPAPVFAATRGGTTGEASSTRAGGEAPGVAAYDPVAGGVFRAPVFPARPRTALFMGPLPPEEDPDSPGDDSRTRAAAGRGPGAAPARGGEQTVVSDRRAGRTRAASARAPRAAFSLFAAPRREGSAARRARGRKAVKPPLLARLLGRGALKPPKSSLVPPDLSRLDAARPARRPAGGPVPSAPFDLERVEDINPSMLPGEDCRKRAPHWHGASYHAGAARGVVEDARWLWLWKEHGRVWASRAPGEEPLLRHQGLWWTKRRGVWFAVHEGDLWSWRRLSAWDAEGLVRLADGVEVVYSADFSRVAVVTPGAGAVLYDAASGAELGRWLESELPRRRPRAPTSLRLPRGI